MQFLLKVADSRYQSLLAAQIAAMNFVQRHANGRDIHFYRIEKGVWLEKRSTPFAIQHREFLWAELAILDRSTGAKGNVEVWILNGRIANLVFAASPAQFIAGMCSFEVLRLNALEQADNVGEKSSQQLPDDLREAAEQTAKGDSAISFTFPEDTYEVVLDQGKFVVIGEVVDVGALMVRSDGHIYLGAYDGSDPQLLGKNCAEAVRAIEENPGKGGL